MTTKHEEKELKRKLKEEQDLLDQKKSKSEKRTKNIAFSIIGIIVLVIIIAVIYKSATKTVVIDDRYNILEGQVVIEEFSDFQCPYCKAASLTVKQIEETYGDKVAILYKHFPLPSHKFAFKAAEASECARDQLKFMEYHYKLFENQDSLNIDSLKKYALELNLNTQQFNECLDSGSKKSIIEKDILEGQKKKVTGTPTFFVDSQRLSGAQPFEKFKPLIERNL